MATPEIGVEYEDGRWNDSSGAYAGDETSPERASGSEMDEQRKQQMAYQYLCHLEEAKLWMEACLKEELPPTTELEEAFRNGVFLAKLGNFFTPETVPLRKIFDKEFKVLNTRGLHFRHTDNINYFMNSCGKVGLPKVFFPETTDIYDRKNMPKLIYCIHALSLYLFKLGLAPQIQDLYGKAKFTEEQISAMRKELEKYGIQMPAFSKIGGILESEMPVDEAALHAAVIAINDAIDHQDANGTLEALRNPSAHLVDISADNAEGYQEALYQAKSSKAAQALAKSPSSEGMDVYDTLLTQAEIQGNISQVNDVIRRKKAEEALIQAVREVNQAVNNNDEEALIIALSNKAAKLTGLTKENGSWYMKLLKEKRNLKQKQTGLTDVDLTQTEIQEAVNAANELAEQHRQMEDIVHCINKSLDMGTVEETHTLIQKPEGMFPKVLTRSAFLYHDGLLKAKQQAMQESDETCLSHQAVCDQLSVLTAVAAINEAIENENSTQLIEKMNHANAGLTSVDESLCNRYLSHLISVKEEKAQDCGVGKDDLTKLEIQICVDYMNTVVQEEHDLISAIAVINEAIDKEDHQSTLQALQADAAKLSGIDPDNSQLYQKLLHSQKMAKAAKADEDTAELWHDEIQRSLDSANRYSDEAQHLAKGVTAINQAIGAQDERLLIAALTYPRANIYGVTSQCIQQYFGNSQLFFICLIVGSDSAWLEQKTSQGHLYYYNTENSESCWEKPVDMITNSAVLTREEIQGVISRVTIQYDRWVHMESNEPLIIKLQSNWKGYLARKAYKERQTFIKEHLPAIIKIQAFVRGFIQKLKYKRRLNELHSHPEEVVKIQSWVSMSLARKKYQERRKYFKDHNSAIVKIQAWLRANVAQNDYRKLISMQDPPVKTVRKFLHLLENSDADFEEELNLQKLRAQVVTEIRSNQQLENDLGLMDIKIGLLVRNRITLQDVIHYGKNLKREKQDMSTAMQRTKGIKSLSKESHEKLEAYQNLFYLLQTNPVYLAKLIFAMPQSRFTKFMESVTLTLYNYASNPREEYLLVKLFDTALKEEIASKVDQMQDIVTGNPAVIRMLVHFNRGTRGQSSLRELLQPLVEGVLNDKNLSINTNPLEVYKAWINQMESETGTASKLPYDVEPEQALKHPEVRERIEAAMKSLTVVTDTFLNSIVQSGDKIPYGMRYVAMSLRVALAEKFPDAPESEILKVVGNLIYYRYMNPEIVAPDAFDIVSVGVDKCLTADQRRNLGSIAKILQYAASNKMFGGESAHLSPLNGYIAEAHQRFKRFFREVSNVEEPEGHFNIDEYTDVVMVTKPVIYISVQEICDTHTLLLDHKDEIAPDPNDPLHELLDDLGDAPSVDALLGETSPEDGEQETSHHSKTEISLTLTNKFEVPDDDDSDMRALFVRTKRMIVDVLKIQAGDNLTEILETPASDEQEEEHTRSMKLRELNEENKSKSHGNMAKSTSAYGDNKLPLEGLKRKIIRNLRMLESQGVVTIKNDYQDIINAIAKDIRNQRRYRQRRRQEKKKLGQTLESLHNKSQFYEEQIDYYNQYIRVCLDNLSKKGKKPRAKQQKGKEDVYRGEIKYTAQRLYEKGVILEIEGLPPSQFKNVMFDIKSADEVGVFEVSAKFMGVAMEKVELVFQDLLQLQYEGVAVMKMFGRAKINVNLLIFLLNKKFYGK
ncbi:ras GTPase-activating-like protein IQGAP1 [Stylophora pistillata]|uniref:ras GTPase-activating-like protein IQGAP1 n=1 Tax=Stylophora pistillata TaxID=50429 RepID=UPI000C052393|nr:ras GTPase-activating-like protein IQGAP1 [Stylophora pistillata]